MPHLDRVRSFDVFDTVLTRAVGDPVALFRVTGERLGLEGVTRTPPDTWARAREQVEWRLTALLHRPPRLHEVHEELARVLGHDPALALAGELADERRLSRPVPGAAERVARARQEAGRVVFVSDTPLPSAFLVELLTAAGLWREGDVCFASAEQEATKSEGTLYPRVAEQLGVQGADWRHTGDNAFSDVAAARLAGVRASLTPGTGLNRYERRLEQDAAATDGLSSFLAGASRLARLEAVDEGRDPDLAAVAGGVAAPLLVGFCLWLLDQAERQGLRRLYFVSRDGEVMLEVVQPLLRALGSDVECRYLYGSRRAWHLASLAAAPDREVADWLNVDNSRLTPRAFLARVAVEPERALALTGHRLFAPAAVDVPLTVAEREELFALATDPVLSAEVLATAEQERDLVLDYLRQEGVGDGTPAALVDVGWLGKTGRSLDDLMRSSGLKVLDAFFYIGLGPEAARYSGPDLAARQSAWLFDHSRARGVPGRMTDIVALVETFCAGSHGSVRGFRREGGRVLPDLTRPDNAGVLAWGLLDVRAVVRRTAELFASSAERAGRPADLRAAAWELMSQFWEHPTPGEVRAWGPVPYDTDSWPVTEMPLVVPVRGEEVLSHLRAGRLRLRHDNSWQAGTASASRQPWRAALLAVARFRRARPRLARVPRRVRLELALRRQQRP